METDKMIFLRNFLFKTFLVGLVLAIILFIGMIALRDIWLSIAMSLFHIEEPEINEAVFSFILDVRLVLMFFFLAPALALHWMVRSKR